MKIILLQDIKSLGKKDDIKNVSDGYARNFLIPKRLAIIATNQTVNELEKRKKLQEKQEQETKNLLSDLVKKINGEEYNFYPAIGKKSEVFGSVTKNDIKEAVLKKHTDIKKEKFSVSQKIKIVLDKPLKTIGEHNVTVLLDGEKAQIKAILNQFSQEEN